MSEVIVKRDPSVTPIAKITALSDTRQRRDSDYGLEIRPLYADSPPRALAYTGGQNGVHLTAQQLRDTAAAMVEMADQLEARA